LDDSEATGKLTTALGSFHQVLTVFCDLRTVD
jgi:hypothetical protein